MGSDNNTDVQCLANNGGGGGGGGGCFPHKPQTLFTPGTFHSSPGCGFTHSIIIYKAEGPQIPEISQVEERAGTRAYVRIGCTRA